jgi:hypothetical protein
MRLILCKASRQQDLNVIRWGCLMFAAAAAACGTVATAASPLSAHATFPLHSTIASSRTTAQPATSTA